MANTLLTPSVIAREALARLQASTVMLALVHRDFDPEFDGARGDTVTVRIPPTLVATEFTGTIAPQDVTESSVAVKLDTILDVSAEVTTKELALSISDFGTQFVQPAIDAIAQAIEAKIMGLYKDVPWTVGTAGTTPDGLDDFAAASRVLDVNMVPTMGRRMVIDPYAKEKFSLIPTFHEADKVGDDGTALREASLGRKLGFDIFATQSVLRHDNGSVASTGTFAVNGAVAAGASTMNVDASTITGTWKKGSLFTIGSDTYTVAADVTASGNALTSVTFYPAAPTGGIADNATITRVANHTAGLAFHRSAFAFVSRTLPRPMGTNNVAVVNYNGVGIRVVQDYDITHKKDIISFDMLCGVKTLDPNRAVRLLG